jgi:hypothetical protein
MPEAAQSFIENKDLTIFSGCLRGVLPQKETPSHKAAKPYDWVSLAEMEGFEPPDGLTRQLISSVVWS